MTEPLKSASKAKSSPKAGTFTHYVRVAFFRGTSLRPVPPGTSKSKDTRYLDIAKATRSTRRRWRRG